MVGCLVASKLGLHRALLRPQDVETRDRRRKKGEKHWSEMMPARETSLRFCDRYSHEGRILRSASAAGGCAVIIGMTITPPGCTVSSSSK